MTKNARISYKIRVDHRDNGRLYEIHANDPVGEITRAVNEKTGCSFIVDFVAETITPSGMSTSTGRVRNYSARFDLKKGEEIRSALAKFALKHDDFDNMEYCLKYAATSWKKQLEEMK